MKALGIIAMIIAIICFFVPVIGPPLTVVAAALAAFSAGPGLTFGAVAIGLNLINLLFLSPSIWLAEVGARAGGSDMGPGVFYLLAQVAAAIILGVLVVKGKNKTKSISSEVTGA